MVTVDEIFGSFNLEGLREFRDEVERMRNRAAGDANITDMSIELTGRVAGYNAVLSELERRIAGKEAP